MLECMNECSFLHGQCQSGVFELANRTCRLFDEPLVELEEGNLEEMVYFMKISSMTSIYVTFFAQTPELKSTYVLPII